MNQCQNSVGLDLNNSLRYRRCVNPVYSYLLLKRSVQRGTPNTAVMIPQFGVGFTTPPQKLGMHKLNDGAFRFDRKVSKDLPKRWEVKNGVCRGTNLSATAKDESERLAVLIR